MQDPASYLTFLEIEVPCAMAPTKRAVLDDAHKLVVNWEVFFFSSADLKARFESEPTAHCGALTDPVTKKRFLPTAMSPRIDHDGRSYFFSSDSTATVFRNDPEPLANPTYRMAMAKTE